MTPDEYQVACSRTEAEAPLIVGEDSRVVHALLGKMSELGELADQFKRHFFYGQALDLDNVIEETGDGFWYDSLLANAMGFTLQECMVGNIAKLKERYPEKFTKEDAAEENRDREREMDSLKDAATSEVDSSISVSKKELLALAYRIADRMDGQERASAKKEIDQFKELASK